MTRLSAPRRGGPLIPVLQETISLGAESHLLMDIYIVQMNSILCQ